MLFIYNISWHALNVHYNVPILGEAGIPQVVEHHSILRVQSTGGGGGEDSPPNSIASPTKIANELIPEPRVSGCTINISITCLQ